MAARVVSTRAWSAISLVHSGTVRLSNLKALSVLSSRMSKSSFSSSVSDKITVNGVDLHYEKAGTEGQVLLCMPGALGSTQSDFGPQLKGLSSQYTVVAFDPRGYGKSRPPERDFPSDFFVRDAWDAAELMRKLGKWLHSLGGGVVWGGVVGKDWWGEGLFFGGRVVLEGEVVEACAAMHKLPLNVDLVGMATNNF